MCGIVGFINIGTPEILNQSTDCISHRGPDDSGIKWFNQWGSGFGHRRLSIIDLSEAGHQPMCNDKGNLWITYNGEIYNYKEIRNDLLKEGYKFKSDSDTEVLLYAYECWGENCLDKLNGMWAFAIFDTEKGELFASRDRIGIKPFYYWISGDKLIFSSEIKAIIKSGLVEIKPDYYSLVSQMHYQVFPYTGFENIFKLFPGHCLKFNIANKNSKVIISKYWDIVVKEEDMSENDAVDKLEDLLISSVKYQMVSDVPVGLFLSGGLDSSIIAALMRKHYDGSINAFTIKYSAEDQKFEKMEDDSKWARKVADLFEFNYEEMIIKPDTEKLLSETIYHLEEPLADPAAINTYLISKFARQNNIIVLLNGIGGDEIFGGYRSHLACLKAEYYRNFTPLFIRNIFEKIFYNIKVANSLKGFKYVRWIKRFLSFASYDQFTRFLLSDIGLNIKDFNDLYLNTKGYENTAFYLLHKKIFDGVDKNVSYLTRMCLNHSKTFLPSHNLLYSDKASMMASVETRPPLTDHRIVEFMFSLPPKFRIKGNCQKYLLKKVAVRYLPKDVVHRPKAPFGSPIRSWIRGPLVNEINAKLSKDRIIRNNIFNPDKVWEIIDKNQNGKEDLAHIVYKMLVISTWLEIFFLNNKFT